MGNGGILHRHADVVVRAVAADCRHGSAGGLVLCPSDGRFAGDGLRVPDTVADCRSGVIPRSLLGQGKSGNVLRGDDDFLRYHQPD